MFKWRTLINICLQRAVHGNVGAVHGLLLALNLKSAKLIVAIAVKGLSMARKTIRQRIFTLKRKFPKRTNYGFLHTKKSDLQRRYSTILVYSLIYDQERGHSLFIWNPHRRGHDWNSREWNAWLNERGIEILGDAVMTAINAKRGANWEMKRLIGFSGDDYHPRNLHVAGEGKSALYKSANRNKRARRNKTHVKRK